jgi:hypothetical protein
VDIDGKLERATDELWCIEDAIMALQDVRGMADVLQTLRDRMIVKSFEVEQFQKLASGRAV